MSLSPYLVCLSNWFVFPCFVLSRNICVVLFWSETERKFQNNTKINWIKKEKIKRRKEVKQIVRYGLKRTKFISVSQFIVYAHSIWKKEETNKEQKEEVKIEFVGLFGC